MKRMTMRFAANAVLDVLLLLICILHLPSVLQRPSAPFDVGNDDGSVLVTRVHDGGAADGIQPGDHLVSWNGQAVGDPEAVEFLGDLGTVGQRIGCVVERQGVSASFAITLIPFYSSPRFLVISFIVGFIIWLTAVFILWNAPPGPAAAVLHWSMIAFAVTILITLGRISPDSVMSYVDRTLFFLAYMSVAALIFYFSVLYPTPKSRLKRVLTLGTFIPAGVLIVGLSLFHLRDLSSGSLHNFESFQFLFDVFHGSLFVYLGGAVFNIATSLKNASTGEERKKLQWIVWGLCIAIVPFLVLVVLPQMLLSHYVIPEEYTTIFFLAVPFSFAMSFLRYRFLDIEVLINRSIVYALLSLFVFVAFALIFLLMTTAFGGETAFREYLVTSLIAIAMALALIPVRDRLQHLVDETLFAARANFRAAVREIAEELHRSFTSDMLYYSLVRRLYHLIPSKTVAAYALEGRSLSLRAAEGAPVQEYIRISEEIRESLRRSPIHRLPDSAGPSSHTGDQAGDRWMRQLGFSVCRPFFNEAGEVIGAITLSRRTGADRYREEEIDLLSNACSQASDVLERLTFQERAFLEQEEKKRIQELSDLKSYFVSSVSHELRMPLTSIRMFAETLRLGRASGAKQEREYLKIIEGESGRLNRLIDNILDFSRVERGMKEYRFAPTSLRTVVRSAVASLKYEYQNAGARLTMRIPARLPEISADGDALEEVIMNLLSNALKYSTTRKIVRIEVLKHRASLDVKVSDKGIGIPADQIPRVFERFYRVADIRAQQVGGVGLGLPLVRHIVDAHGGSVSIRSIVGKGTSVTVTLPNLNNAHSRKGSHEANSDH